MNACRVVGATTCCIRGTVGCVVNHHQAKAIANAGIARAGGLDALQSSAGRPSDDFEGCIE